MGLYRKKPVVIEARRYFAESKYSIISWLLENNQSCYAHLNFLRILTLEGEMTAEFGDWIIKGVQGEFYPCKNDIFMKTYTLVEE